jgi:tetratricopeptide (TPR) repeat protein
MRRKADVSLRSRIYLATLTIFLFMGIPAHGKPNIEDAQKGQFLLEQWRIEEADSLAQSLMQHFPESGDAHFLKARVQFFKGQYDEAWKTLKRVSDKQAIVKEFKTLVEQTRQATSAFATHETAHFIFRFTKGADEILVHYAEEVLERSWQLLGTTFDYFPKEKVLVEFYPDKEPFSRISPLTLLDIMTSGTVALCKYNRIMMISPASMVRGYNWMDTLSHEFTHYIITKKSNNNIPLWINEGIAKSFETRWRGGASPMEPIMENILAQGLANDYLIPLENMMPSLAKLKTAEDVQLAFAQVTTMVDYMVDLKGDKVIPALLNDMALEIPFEQALLKNLGLDLDTFQKDWKKYVAQRKLRTIPGLKLVNIRFKDSRQADGEENEYKEIDDKSVQNLAFLGDILKSRNHVRAAIIEYKKALKESSAVSPILHNKLAGTYLLTKEYDQAEPLLKESLKHYPTFHTTLANLGELYYATEKYKQAGEYFESAIRINPFNPFVHQRLISIDQKLGNKKAAETQGRLYKFLE